MSVNDQIKSKLPAAAWRFCIKYVEDGWHLCSYDCGDGLGKLSGESFNWLMTNVRPGHWYHPTMGVLAFLKASDALKFKLQHTR